MLKSMTGFGRGESCGHGKRFTVELKSVNHRFCEVVLRFPRSMVSLEDRARRFIQSRISRGRIDGYFSVEECGERSPVVKVDKALATSYYKAMEELKATLGLTDAVSIQHLINLPGLLVVDEPAEDDDALWPVVSEALEQALGGLMQMRLAEGSQLKADLTRRLKRVEELNEQIKARAPQVVTEYHNRLTQRLQEWLRNVPLDQTRLATEVAIFAERASIAEEVVRLASHIVQFREFLDEGGPVGRKLDFLIQEMNREINTIASKAPDLEISRVVVEVKSELEKMREQVQNIE
ncbi:YicC/YloC family endoribonuclease [Desulfofundulus sp.]|uniref:YicC/YloC family endoribonuclease n=1 Tax=Desulfofundulus sp. TaxID=2282750 RepID=UPI003C742545